MKTISFESREDWLEARRGKITGSRLKDIVMKRGTGYKMGYYELIAERLATAPDGENPMDRGTRLEEEAIARFVEETGKKVDTSLVIWAREDNEMQRIQYFIVNDSLKKLHFVFYDPRIPCKDYFVLETKREDVQAEVDEFLAYEESILKEVDQVVNELTF